MSNSSVNLRFLLISTLVLGLLGTASYLVLDKVYRLEMRDQASVVADNVEAFGRWVAKFGRVWVDTDTQSSHLGRRRVVDADTPWQRGQLHVDWVKEHSITLYSKNPALAQREFSEVAWESNSPAKFRMTSDNYMNPLNKPDKFELAALTSIKATGATEYERFDTQKQVYRYARAIRHKSACITCHGRPEDAPADVLARYGKTGGFGFEEGDVAGVISVRLPLTPFVGVVAPFIGASEIALLLAALLIPVLFIHFSVLRPIKTLAGLATQASTGATEDLPLPAARQDTRNEILQLGLAIKRLNVSTRMSLSRMAKPKEP